MATSIAKNFELCDIKVTDVWNEAETQISQKLQYKKFGFKERDAKNLETTIQNFTSFDTAGATGELEPYNLDDIEAAGFITLRPEKFTAGFKVSEEMIRMSLWDTISMGTKKLANSLNRRIDTNVANILTEGFNTSVFAGPNGEALFSTHVLKKAPSQSNYLGAIPLTYDNLKVASQLLDTQYDDSGVRLLNGNRKILVVSQFLKHKALEILKSIGSPDTANRVSNVWMTLEGEIELVISDYTDKNGAAAKKFNWFLIDTMRAGDMAHIIWGWKPRFDTENAINNGSKIYTGTVYFKTGWNAHQWVVGSDSLTG
jgi:hypothetical protein